LGARPPADARDAPFDEAAFRRAFRREEFEGLRDGRRTECLSITYRSDGLDVRGVVVRPRQGPPAGAPGVLYARGGWGAAGKIRLANLLEFQRLAERGYAVLATEYRGNHGSDGADENGGRDIRDLTNLVRVARELGGIDVERLFFWGESRGAMMALLALSRGAPVRAAVVSGAVTDLEALLQARPELEAELAVVWPDAPGRRADRLAERSALRWPERIGRPLLLLHGGRDWRSDVSQSRRLAAALGRLGRPHELVVYEDDDHGLQRHRVEAFEAMVSWFERHDARRPSTP
jgi:dipeptidyl aminopeptidase/acylaminoacyl peptidase